jgi:hypothetical protein
LATYTTTALKRARRVFAKARVFEGFCEPEASSA